MRGWRLNASKGPSMQALRRQSPDSEVTRADIILARKHAPRRPGARNLLEIAVPRREPRQTHQRHEDRRVLTGAKAKLLLGKRTMTVPVANISSNGIMIDCHRPFAIGQELAVAIDRCDAIPMIVRWVRNGRVGLEFLAETTIVAKSGVQEYIIEAIQREHRAATLRQAPLVGAEKRKGSPRHALMWLCQLTAGATTVAARIRNISAEGAMLSYDEMLEPIVGEPVTLAMGEGRTVAGHIRWVADGFAGLSFFEPFPVEDLIELPCAHIVEEYEEPVAQPVYASREEAMRIAYTGVTRPYDAPDMDYKPLTMRELYETLYTRSEAIAP